MSVGLPFPKQNIPAQRRRQRLGSWSWAWLWAALAFSLAATLTLAGCGAWPSDRAASPPAPGASPTVLPSAAVSTLPPPSPSILPPPSVATAFPTRRPPTATPITPSPLPPSATVTETPLPPSPTLTPSLTPVRFAVIGDYGSGDEHAKAVATLIASWQVDFIITVGDNNYPDGSAETIDANIGQWYADYIHPYHGNYGPGATINRFFPAIGNHDWGEGNYQAYLDYFELPGNERYYDFTWGPVHLFCLNSDSREPDKVGRSSVQADWLRERLAAATLPWKIVYAHHPPYSSGYYEDTDWMQWPFAEWGATAMIAGHIHSYERLIVDGFPYFINGLGGGERYPISRRRLGSAVQYDENFGAMLVEASMTEIIFQFINIENKVIDVYHLRAVR